jgi:hypothetical protein
MIGFVMKNITLKASLASVTLMALMACSGLDVNANAVDKSGEQGDATASTQVPTYSQLPSCSQKREGVVALVVDENANYYCSNGLWEMQNSNGSPNGGSSGATNNEIASEDDLPACIEKNEGVLKVAGGVAYRCVNRKWENLGFYSADENALTNCTVKRDGEIRFVADLNVSLICSDERWENLNGSEKTDPPAPTQPDTTSAGPATDNPNPNPTVNPNPENPSSYYNPPSTVVSSSSSAVIVLPTPVVSSSSVTVTPTPKSSASTPKSSSSKAKSSSSTVKSSSSVTAPVITTPACGDMWCGPNGDPQVLTGLDESPTENAGYWWSYDDNENGGASKLIWPTALGDLYDENSLTPVIEECGGVCGKYSLDEGILTYSYVGVAFNIGGASRSGTPYIVDASAWKGVCVVYTSDIDITLEIGLGTDYDKLVAYDNPAATLAAAKNTTIKNVTWASFKQQGWGVKDGGEQISGTAASKQIASLKFKLQGKDGSKGNFNIMSVGTYGSCQ